MLASSYDRSFHAHSLARLVASTTNERASSTVFFERVCLPKHRTSRPSPPLSVPLVVRRPAGLPRPRDWDGPAALVSQGRSGCRHSSRRPVREENILIISDQSPLLALSLDVPSRPGRVKSQIDQIADGMDV